MDPEGSLACLQGLLTLHYALFFSLLLLGPNSFLSALFSNSKPSSEPFTVNQWY